MKEQWTRERANEWYAAQGWLRGCNFIGSDCVNRLDMFQKYGAEAKLATADRELALCREIGFNTVRIWANFDVYYAEPESYFEIFEKYIELCDKHGQKVMVVLTHEEDLPRGDVFAPKKMGEQAYALGEHQGRIPLSAEEAAKPPRHYLEYPELREKFFTMISETVRRYARDERVICWNIYNEPGITIGARSCDILRELFALVRAEDPIQPLCADMWRGTKHGIASEEEKLAIELSDVISFHSYQAYEKLVVTIKYLERYGRPLLLTEWLHRINHNNFAEIYPLLYITNVANYCWGFVVGKTQTHEPWPSLWEECDRGGGDRYDFTKWQHDLFRPNLRPYDPREIALIKKFNALADADKSNL